MYGLEFVQNNQKFGQAAQEFSPVASWDVVR